MDWELTYELRYFVNKESKGELQQKWKRLVEDSNGDALLQSWEYDWRKIPTIKEEDIDG